MNIFVLDENPVICAQYHCDRHVVKMVLETAQILSTVSGNGYKPTHERHPCTLWACTSRQNYNWLLALGLALGEEYTYRYDKIHKSHIVIQEQLSVIPEHLPNSGLTPFKQCMPLHYIKYKDPVGGYQEYYRQEKAHFCTWKRRPVPYFMENV